MTENEQNEVAENGDEPEITMKESGAAGENGQLDDQMAPQVSHDVEMGQE